MRCNPQSEEEIVVLQALHGIPFHFGNLISTAPYRVRTNRSCPFKVRPSRAVKGLSKEPFRIGETTSHAMGQRLLTVYVAFKSKVKTLSVSACSVA